MGKTTRLCESTKGVAHKKIILDCLCRIMVGEYMSSALYWINEVVKKIKSVDWGLTKLVRVLNEYEDEKELVCGRRNYKWHYDEENDGIYAERIDGSELGPEESWAAIICRGYCFIWRLVENDKIDRDKKEIEKSDYDITFTWALTMDKKSDLDIMVDTLLMLLINIRYTYWRPYFIS